MLDKQRVRDQFSRHAHQYDQYALLQKEIGTALLAKVEGSPDRILDLGCGTGSLTIDLAKRFPAAEIYGMDLAPGMITRAQQKAIKEGCEQIEFVVGDMECPTYPAESFDLVISNVSFQWANRLPEMFIKICEILRPEGVFLFTLFGENSLKELRAASKHALKTKYVHEQTFPVAKDIARYLAEAGFMESSATNERNERYYDSLKHLLLSMKNIGAQNSVSTRPDKLITKHDLKNLETYYRNEFGVEQKLKATYEIIFGEGYKTETGNERQETR